MKPNQLSIDRVQPITQTGQLIPAQSTELYNLGSWLKNGDSPAEIILATAILVTAIAGLLAIFRASKQQ